MFLEFSGYSHPYYRFTNKRTGTKLKKPVIDEVIKNKLIIDTEFIKAEKNSYFITTLLNDSAPVYISSHRDIEIEKNIFDNKALTYTKDNVLKVIENITGVKYDDIEILNKLEKPDSFEEYENEIKQKAANEQINTFINKWRESFKKDNSNIKFFKNDVVNKILTNSSYTETEVYKLLDIQ